MRASRRLNMGSAAFGIGVVVGLLLLAGTTGSPLPGTHFACERGKLLASQYSWTPDMFWNAPYGGSVYGQVENSRGEDAGGAHNGEVAVAFGMIEWNLSSVNRVLVAGLGSSPGCPTYLAEGTPNLPPWQQSGGCVGCDLLGPGNESDASEPSSFNVSLWTSVGSMGATSTTFHEGFTEDNGGIVSTCGGPARELNVTSKDVHFQVPFRVPHGTVIFNASVYNLAFISQWGYTANFTYFFPADFGTWEVDNLTLGSDAPGGGLSFAYSACPS
ncbi:MAG: hypothetical protein WCB19_06860 [Thermoplasmata archaeon]